MHQQVDTVECEDEDYVDDAVLIIRDGSYFLYGNMDLEEIADILAQIVSEHAATRH
jgi:hypothetical protein